MISQVTKRNFFIQVPREEFACPGWGHVTIPGTINYGQENTQSRDGVHVDEGQLGGCRKTISRSPHKCLDRVKLNT